MFKVYILFKKLIISSKDTNNIIEIEESPPSLCRGRRNKVKITSKGITC